VNKSYRRRSSSRAAAARRGPGRRRFDERRRSNANEADHVAEKYRTHVSDGEQDALIEIRDMIDRLDRRQSQVLLETALIELTTNDAIKLGIELGFVTVPPRIRRHARLDTILDVDAHDTNNDIFRYAHPDNTLQV